MYAMAAPFKDLSRTRIVAAARGWLGTPYVHQASMRGAGCDCLGLVRGVWRETVGPEPEAAPAYTPDWAERRDEETLLFAARRHLVGVDCADMGPGDVLAFRMMDNAVVKHVAILTTPDQMIHAYWGRAVVESALSPWWRRRLVAAFAFPGVCN